MCEQTVWRKRGRVMTNLEWIRTLSEEEFADWLYDEWLHHLQYRWSSSRGGLIIWLKDRKTENSSEKPNSCEPQIYGNEHNCIMTLFGDCSYAETGCGDCEVVEKVRKALDNYEPKTEPQTERSE